MLLTENKLKTQFFDIKVWIFGFHVLLKEATVWLRSLTSQNA